MHLQYNIHKVTISQLFNGFEDFGNGFLSRRNCAKSALDQMPASNRILSFWIHQLPLHWSWIAKSWILFASKDDLVTQIQQFELFFVACQVPRNVLCLSRSATKSHHNFYAHALVLRDQKMTWMVPVMSRTAMYGSALLPLHQSLTLGMVITRQLLLQQLSLDFATQLPNKRSNWLAAAKMTTTSCIHLFSRTSYLYHAWHCVLFDACLTTSLHTNTTQVPILTLQRFLMAG